MKLFRFHPEAEQEMFNAALWYESQQKDLGKRFLSSVQDSLNSIKISPQKYPEIEPPARRCLVKTFPFGVIFQIRDDAIVIMAVMHLHREPGYWKNRVN